MTARGYLLRRRLALSAKACQVLLGAIENDLLALSLYPEYAGPLRTQIEASSAALRQELATIVMLDQKLAQAAK